MHDCRLAAFRDFWRGLDMPKKKNIFAPEYGNKEKGYSKKEQ